MKFKELTNIQQWKFQRLIRRNADQYCYRRRLGLKPDEVMDLKNDPAISTHVFPCTKVLKAYEKGCTLEDLRNITGLGTNGLKDYLESYKIGAGHMIGFDTLDLEQLIKKKIILAGNVDVGIKHCLIPITEARGMAKRFKLRQWYRSFQKEHSGKNLYSEYCAICDKADQVDAERIQWIRRSNPSASVNKISKLVNRDECFVKGILAKELFIAA